MRRPILSFMLFMVFMTSLAFAQETQVAWDPVEKQSPPEGVFAGVLMWYLFFSLLVWFCLLFRPDWAKVDPRTRIFGNFDRGSLSYSPSVPGPLRSALIPGRTWQEMLLFISVAIGVTFLLNHYFVQWWEEYQALVMQ